MFQAYLLGRDADSSSSFIGQPMDCPCVGVRDSRYDNSCESQKTACTSLTLPRNDFIMACTFRSSLEIF